MNNTIDVKNEKGTGTVITWFKCTRCPVEADRGIKVRVGGVSETLCRECYKELLRKKGTAAAGRRD